MKLRRVRATTRELSTLYAWHYGGAVPSTGPILGIDHLAGGAPFGIDPLQLVRDEVITNPNMVVAGAPGNGKSAFVKSMIWWLVGAWGYRFVVTDVKSEYRALAGALDVPVLDLHPGGTTRVNPLDDPNGRVDFLQALTSMCVDRSLQPVERAALGEVEKVLPERAQLAHVLEILREIPEEVCQSLVMKRDQVLDATQEVRFGLGELLGGSWAGMFNGETNVNIDNQGRGFVVDVSKCGTDDRVLRLALLAGQRATTQMLRASTRPTLRINDEGWRLTSTLEGARWMQSEFKLGRNDALANILVVHRFSEIGTQADGVASQIASKLVSDADIRVMFRQGDHDDAADCVERLDLPKATADTLIQLVRGRAIVAVRGRIATLQTILSETLLDLADTNSAVRGNSEEVA